MHAHGLRTALSELEGEQWCDGGNTDFRLGFLFLGPIEGGTEARLWKEKADQREEGRVGRGLNENFSYFGPKRKREFN